MQSFFWRMAQNAAVTTALIGLLALTSSLLRTTRPALLHALWVVVLLKFLVGLIRHLGEFPPWFPVLFLSGVAILVGLIAAFILQLIRSTRPVAFNQSRMSHVVWALAAISVFCTSSVHKFYPFHPGILEWWPLIPNANPVGARLLRLNYVLTATALVLTLLLWAAYGLKRRGSAVVGAMVLAGLLLLR